MSGGVDGIQPSSVGVALDTRDSTKPKKRFNFNAAETFGLIAYFVVLYSCYGGFFAMLLVIALRTRKDNYLHLNKRLSGHAVSDDYYTTPWLWLADNFN
ncbi:hypothetical protein GPECTOR_10g881 [Gonium pectorale]|uniref:Uncharacterized protein n=1 Tax=Gonium pectorale TaxID=33097 RepID=A0A150GSF1_GONPE|nr:hypothetical protein GPECTOR_10g881 [Gonium pectorale]|eukprot:KXZ52250.1 hypothetical protein GPECTOR_10g881 [Gonium pectorale]